MRVLTVRQPWAGAMFEPLIRHRKDVENRTWQPASRGRIAIHSGQRVDDAASVPNARVLREHDLGVVLGTVEIVRWHRAASDECYAEGCLEHGVALGEGPHVANPWARFDPDSQPWHWILRHPRELVTPIRARGRLGLWEAGPSLAHLLEISEYRS